MSKYEIGSITVYDNAKQTEDNPQGLGSYLVLSGMGCDEVFRIQDMSNDTFGDVFKRCEHWFQDSFHFTRLDVAIDDKNEVPYFTIEQLKRKCEKENKPHDEIGCWKRTEMQLRDDKAHAFAMLFKDDPYDLVYHDN